jgi:hypothetical protein
MYVTDDAKKLLKNHKDEKEEIARRKQLELDQMKSVITTNKSSRRSNILSPIFAALAALAAILTFFNERARDNNQQASQEQLQLKLQQQDNALRTHQMQIDSLLRESKPLNSVKNDQINPNHK